MVEQAYRSATSFVAAEFLKLIAAQFPFPIVSLQVDGGSEFMGEFEKGCKLLGYPFMFFPLGHQSSMEQLKELMVQ